VQATSPVSLFFRIGTRGSPLALAQAHDVRRRLIAAHGEALGVIEVVVIKTSGDRIQDRPLSEVGGKGLFTKEIEEALFAKTIDIAVHSMKDLETQLPDGLAIGAVLPREDVRDAFISLRHKSLIELPQGAIVGTSSLRRSAQIRRLRPDVRVVEFRGNVETRLKKLEQGVAEATFLACAGLNRLQEAHRITQAIDPDHMLPAVAQGAVAVQFRRDDEAVAQALAPLDDAATALAVTAERAFLGHLDGSCRTALAGLATLDGGALRFRGELLAPDGSQSWRAERTGRTAEAVSLALDVAADISRQSGVASVRAAAQQRQG
jgi:hydroxymethylbilane synthase